MEHNPWHFNVEQAVFSPEPCIFRPHRCAALEGHRLESVKNESTKALEEQSERHGRIGGRRRREKSGGPMTTMSVKWNETDAIPPNEMEAIRLEIFYQFEIIDCGLQEKEDW